VPDVIAYNVVISVCGCGQQHQHALRLLRATQRRAIVPNVITYSDTIVEVRAHCHCAIKIVVKTLTGKTITFDAETSGTINDVEAHGYTIKIVAKALTGKAITFDVETSETINNVEVHGHRTIQIFVRTLTGKAFRGPFAPAGSTSLARGTVSLYRAGRDLLQVRPLARRDKDAMPRHRARCHRRQRCH